MDLRCVSHSGRLRAVLVIGFLGFVVGCHASEADAETSAPPEETGAEAYAIRDVRSRHFLIHTDLSSDKADDFVERLEAMLGFISKYWGQPTRGVIECYIVHSPNEFPVAAIAPFGLHAVKTVGGATLWPLTSEGKRKDAKSVVYASARLEVVQHEAIHAYCHQTFGRIGPVWYSEGMAEVGRFWKDGDIAVRADPREIEFLRNNPPRSLAELVSPAQVTGDCWQNYASRWALCHFLVSNSNYSYQFRQLGSGLLTGKDVSFEQTYAATTRPLFFEYLSFLQHISQGYRVDLCAWDWNKKFTGLQPGRSLKATIAAGRGWQPTGLTVRAGKQYEYLATGAWQIARQPEAVDADGDDQGRGRLVGVLMKDYRLGAEFELGTKGSLQLKTDGDLYLRCRNHWNELAADVGRVTVKFQLQTQGRSVSEADSGGHVGQ
jgi:hypothetical protein